MKALKALKTLVAAAAVLSAVVFSEVTAYAGVDILMDATVGCNTMVNDQTLTVNHIKLPGYNATIWADFRWDPNNLVFVPVNAGIEYSGTKNFSGVMTNAAGMHEYSDDMNVDFAIDATNGIMHLTFTATKGQPFVCYTGWYFKQGNKDATDGMGDIDKMPDTFLIPVAEMGGWGDCDNIPAGVTKTATALSFPVWFDFGKPFTFGQTAGGFNELNIP